MEDYSIIMTGKDTDPALTTASSSSAVFTSEIELSSTLASTNACTALLTVRFAIAATIMPFVYCEREERLRGQAGHFILASAHLFDLDDEPPGHETSANKANANRISFSSAAVKRGVDNMRHGCWAKDETDDG